jgi:hypothetical protein
MNDVVRGLSKISCPVLIVQGMTDPLMRGPGAESRGKVNAVVGLLDHAAAVLRDRGWSDEPAG